MLPSILSRELRNSVAGFLRQAFPFANPWLQRTGSGEDSPLALIDRLIDEPGRLFRGPYLDIKLPFRMAGQETLPFSHVELPFTPYRHQLKAFARLGGDNPVSTIVATGTGSGKTECFMLPVLDDCLKRREQGIKTIVIYPMNALATDQAKRFAKEVAKLDTQLTVGLFVGSEAKSAPGSMGAGNVITHHDTLRQNPPDILLTNYKMLDFLLIRPKDQPLWRFNKPGMLRYLVVDELHSFDGAQGTDLACLIRRLRDRLGAGHELACVGTSATIGSEASGELLDYASDVFATPFDAEAVVEEDRLSPAEYLKEATSQPEEKGLAYFAWPDRHEARLDPSQYRDADTYLHHQAQVWFEDLEADKRPALNAGDARRRTEAAVSLGKLLHRHAAFHELINAGGRVRSLDELIADWQAARGLRSRQQAEWLLLSLIALVSAARRWNQPESEDPDDWTAPLLDVRLQLWLRELKRMVCTVPTGPDNLPELDFSDDLQSADQELKLPLLHCRECHLGAWGAVERRGSNRINPELKDFYQAWFSYSTKVRLLVPLTDDQEPEDHLQYLCPKCERLQSGSADNKCAECSTERLQRVWVPDMVKLRGAEQRPEGHHDCPDCGARDSLAIVGYQAATLASVMCGRLFNTPFNDDFKLIAFSDSVQDAAHRAGFLEANTWRQVLRQAMVRWLEQQPRGISLAEMAEQMPAYWKHQARSPAHFSSLFMPHNLAWHPDYRKLKDGEAEELPPGSPLPGYVQKRLSWECVAEFGRRSQIGRSLERTAAAAVGPDWRALAGDIRVLAERLREELGSLREASDEVFEHFVLGWLHRMRTLGAVDHPALGAYLKHGGKEYIINAQIKWMPNYGRSRRPPAAITLQHVTPNFEAMVLSRQDSWSVRWLKKTLGAEALFAPAEARQIFALMIEHLEKRGWLREYAYRDKPLWMLNPERLLVDRDVATLRCEHCRHALTVSRAVTDRYEDMSCLRANCQGLLHEGEVFTKEEHYGLTEPRRLLPHEHTGLLERSVRERVEHSFITGHEPWHVNLLSATPTLELGIDIGALSSVLLCSVPPSQANYLQRIGRAGRRDGNALAVTIANGRPHDLYFYEDPLEMIAGDMQTPGVFLKATAVLERQLIAYCFDRWTASGIDESAIPGQLRKALQAVEHQRTDQFPYNLLDFVRDNADTLLADFVQLFEGLATDQAARDYLSSFIHEQDQANSIHRRLLDRLQQIVRQHASLRKKVKDLKKKLDWLEKQPEDDSIKEERRQALREKEALQRLVSERDKQSTLNFFTDEGLLPNYAFPEEGVTLQSVIYRRLEEDEKSEDGGRYEKVAYSFQRPAQAALGELAPESRFYAVSHEMEIDQVDVDLMDPETWRFCDQCHYSENTDEKGDRHSACPRCGSAQWADSGQRQTVLRLRQVYSTVDARKGRIGDESEQRVPAFFNRQMLVDVEPQHIREGFRILDDTLPFGFEFVEKITLREVNFGPAGDDSRSFSVAGQELGRQGFQICRHCGKVQKPNPPRYGYEPHAYSCPLRSEPEKGGDEDFYRSLYLYRELESEAIRILLPLSEVAYSDQKLHSFIAAFNLGLKAHFRGDVGHLQVTDMTEPARDGSAERIYLVIYDRIPGGTGYLKELREPGTLFKVLKSAHDVLSTCGCINDERERDGCYRCILAYRESRNMEDISRRAAEELLREILDRQDRVERVSTLSEINTNVLIESKLEQRFLDALKALPEAQVSYKRIRGKNGWLLTLPDENGNPIPWNVEHQVRVGPDQGVALNTDIDVLLSPAREGDAGTYRPIAVYTDGLQYHHDRVDDDVCKRSALLLSGCYWVFSFTWDDFSERGFLPKPLGFDLMRDEEGTPPQLIELFNKLADRAGLQPATEHSLMHARGGMDWLQDVLRNPELPKRLCRERALYRGWLALAPHRVKDAAFREGLAVTAGELAPAPVTEALALTDLDRVPGGFGPDFGHESPGLDLLVTLPVSRLKSPDRGDEIVEAMRLHLCFDDRDQTPTDAFKEAWRAFWHAVNQLQFLPGFSMASRRAIGSGSLDKVWEQASSLNQALAEVGTPEDAAWQEVEELTLLDPEQLAAVRALDLPTPVIGLDVADEQGAVILDGNNTDLVWPDHKIAVVVEKVEETISGWHIVLADQHLAERLNEAFDGGPN